MRVLKTRWFARWARREGLKDAALLTAVDEMRGGLVDALLGGGLIKKRIARPGRGKSSGYRALVATDFRDRCIFLHGFAKSERENVSEKDLFDLRRLAQTYLSMSDTDARRLIGADVLVEIPSGKSETS